LGWEGKKENAGFIEEYRKLRVLKKDLTTHISFSLSKVTRVESICGTIR
jgi:hypothetical protein